MKTIEELQAYIESRFPCVEGNAAALSQTGEPYVVIGQRPDLSLPSGQDPESALGAARKAFDDYAADKTGTLYWRSPPEIGEVRPYLSSRRFGEPVHSVYLRLLISDLPALERAS